MQGDKISSELKKQSLPKTPDPARGKTYVLLEFGRKHYENVVYFNFETNPKLIRTFEECIEPSYLIPLLSRIAGQTIIREKTLVIFDEVQLCERAPTALK